MGNKPSPKDFKAIVKKKISSFMYWLGQGYTMDDVEFVSSCSDFLVQFMRKDYGSEMNIKVLGMPRNDGLFQPERMKKETWIPGLEGKTVITYMPTHRKYGNGKSYDINAKMVNHGAPPSIGNKFLIEEFKIRLSFDELIEKKNQYLQEKVKFCLPTEGAKEITHILKTCVISKWIVNTF